MALHLERPVSAAALLLFAWVWPAEEVPVSAGRKAALLAVCRDEIASRMGVELDPEVLELPSVDTQPGGRFLLTASVTIAGQPESFSCEVRSADDVLLVSEVRLLHR